MKNLYKNSYPYGKISKITKEELSFESIITDIYNMVEDRWAAVMTRINLFDVGESFTGYSKDELKEFITDTVKSLYDENGVHYEL